MPLPEPTDLDRIEAEITILEGEIRKWQCANRDFQTSVFDVAERLGRRARYEELLKAADELMWAKEKQRPISGKTR